MRCGVVTGHERSADGKIFCNQRFVVRTDPKNDDYELVEGLRRKVETWESDDAETLSLHDPETRLKMQNDPMFRAEKTIRDKQRERSQKERLAELQDFQDERADTYTLNCMLRKSNREARKEEFARAEAARKAGPANFGLPLLPQIGEDAQEAARVAFLTDHDKVEVAARRAAASAAPVLKKRAASTANDGGAGAKLAELVGKRRRLAQHARMARLFA